METDGTIDPIAIDDAHGRLIVLGAAASQFLRQCRPLQKAERTPRAQFHVV
jgi:hypothetical protein